MDRRLALVTGASAGIGEAFARLYAARGWDVALTARRAERLDRLAAELRASHGVDVHAVADDLADPAAPARILERLAARDRHVDAVVNNAGYGVPGHYADTAWTDQAAFLQVMTVAPCEFAHRLVGGMAARGFGRIVNVASLAALAPGAAGATLYAASKAFLVRFSQSLHLETLGQGIHVTALCPGFTWSEFHDVTGSRAQVSRGVPSWAWMTSEAVALVGYAAVEANRPVCVPGAANKAAALLAKLLPERLGLTVMRTQGPRMRGRYGA
jgi:short-subunit dehydrogenase